MKKITSILSLIFLALGAFILWELLVKVVPPEAPKATVTIPEGWTVHEINEYLRKEGILTSGELSNDLEGYLFPDTYEFFLGSSPEVVVARFKENFEAKVAEAGIDTNQPDFHSTLIMASLIEKEVKDHGEQRIASGILWKRLAEGVALQVDATICYMKAPDECLPITVGDKAVDSPYNTYLYRGLPPGPISNPGLNSIKAADKPVASPYWYYLSDPETGKTVFAKTLDEHGSNIIKYLHE